MPVQAEREAHAQTQQQLAEARAEAAEQAAAEKRGMQEDIDGLQQQLEQVRASRVLQCDGGLLQCSIRCHGAAFYLPCSIIVLAGCTSIGWITHKGSVQRLGRRSHGTNKQMA